MRDKLFFKESKEQSRIKAEIVSKYFWAWAKVVIPTTKRQGIDKVAYIDLFAGPGRYEDGAKSTPLLVLEKASEDPDISQMLVSIFNDGDSANASTLEELLDRTTTIKNLRYRPRVFNNEVGELMVERLESIKLVPALFFIDPWGYKGLSLKLINSVLQNWGSDCIFFFNYNRINMGLDNPVVRGHMNALFGASRAAELSWRIHSMSPVDREKAILEELAEALRVMDRRYVLPFRFKDAKGRTSHYLIFVSKDFKGYEIMKDIMARESTTAPQGVPSFEYDPNRRANPFLLDPHRPLDELKTSLLEDFAGRQLRMNQVYEAHSVDTPFIKRNYKQALMDLEKQGRIEARPSAENRRKGTFADHVLVNFPSALQGTDEHGMTHPSAG